MECSDEAQLNPNGENEFECHLNEEILDNTNQADTNCFSEMECEVTPELNETCVDSTCDTRYSEENAKKNNNCSEDVEAEEKLRERLRELSKEYNRLKNIMLGKLLQLAKLLVEYESTQSSRYLYVPEEKPNQEMMSRIALDIFPEFRQLERTQRIVAELLNVGLDDEL